MLLKKYRYWALQFLQTMCSGCIAFGIKLNKGQSTTRIHLAWTQISGWDWQELEIPRFVLLGC